MATPYKVEVKLRCTAVVTGVPIVMEWTQDEGLSWQAGGTVLESTAEDWLSTTEHLEEELTCTTANTYYSWEITPSSLNYSGKLYVRFRDTTENYAENKNSVFASRENTTQAYRPKVVITFANPNSLRLLSATGAGV